LDFSKLEKNYSLFELTLQRNAKLAQKTLIVSNEAQYFLALDQLDEMKARDKANFKRTSHLSYNLLIVFF